MKHILFVDDEPKILQGIERMLRSKHNSWKMVFALGGEVALQELKKDHFDVIVSDMRMPKIDGATLLKEVQNHYPHIVRIVLSGYAEMETALRAVPVAHQFLSKPCDAKHLEEVVDRACNLQTLLKDESLQNIVGKIDQLPALPKIYHELTKALAQPDSSIKAISAIVEQDIAISAKVLQLVNSAFFSLPRRVTSVATAVSCIGLNMLKNLALSVEVFRAFPNKKNFPDFSLEKLQSHALLTANIAKQMFSNKQKSEDAFIAGMLHDIGELIFMVHLPEKFCQLLTAVKENNKNFYLAEKEIFGITHTEIGGYLLGIWGLPYPVIEAVANHHEPQRVPHEEFDILEAIYIATHLAEGSNELDLDYLKKLNVLDQLPTWNLLAQQLKTNPEVII